MEANWTTKNYTFCSLAFQEFFQHANPYIYTINLAVCCIGTVTNILNVVVFTRRHMVNAINVLLAAIALSDIVVMVTYIPQYLSLQKSFHDRYEYFTAVAWIIHEYFLAVFNNTSIWLTVTLSIWRYIAVIHPFQSKSLCTIKRAFIAMGAILALNLTITIPGYAEVQIKEFNDSVTLKQGGCGGRYCARWKEPITFLREVEFMYQGAVSKIVPCLVLTYVSIRLIIALAQSRRKRQEMDASIFRLSTTSTGSMAAEHITILKKDEQVSAEFDKTTFLLLLVVVVFLVTELPASVFVTLEIFLKEKYYAECRGPAHYLILMMYYINGTFTFVVYISMSTRYRETLIGMLTCKKVKTKFPGV